MPSRTKGFGVVAERPSALRSGSDEGTRGRFGFVESVMRAVVARLRGLAPALLGLLALAVVAGVLVPAWGPLTRQAERTAAVLRSSDPRALALALIMAAFAVVCTGLAWVVAARSLGSRETFRAGLTRYTVACWAPPKLGNPC